MTGPLHPAAFAAAERLMTSVEMVEFALAAASADGGYSLAIAHRRLTARIAAELAAQRTTAWNLAIGVAVAAVTIRSGDGDARAIERAVRALTPETAAAGAADPGSTALPGAGGGRSVEAR